jgi:hypothetical protein
MDTVRIENPAWRGGMPTYGPEDYMKSFEPELEGSAFPEFLTVLFKMVAITAAIIAIFYLIWQFTPILDEWLGSRKKSGLSDFFKRLFAFLSRKKEENTLTEVAPEKIAVNSSEDFGEYIAEARNRGDWTTVVILLYRQTIMLLAEKGLIAPNDSKTAGDYVREAKISRDERRVLRDIANKYQSVSFSEHPTDMDMADNVQTMQSSLLQSLAATGTKVIATLLISLSLLSCEKEEMIYDWNPTYNYNSSSPFGSAYMNRLLANEMEDVAKWRKQTIVVSTDDTINNPSFDEIKNTLLGGKRAVYSGLQLYVGNTQLSNEGSKFSVEAMVEEVNEHEKLIDDTLYLKETYGVYPFPKMMMGYDIDMSQLNKIAAKIPGVRTRILLTDREGHVKSALLEHKKQRGRVTFISAPLILTNFTLNYDEGRDAAIIKEVFRKTGVDEQCEWYRHGITYEPRFYKTRFKPLEANKYQSQDTESDDSGRGLSGLLWLILVGSFFFVTLLLFKRRQKEMPVVRDRENLTAHFIDKAAHLYLYHKDYGQLLAKKTSVFFSKIRRQLGLTFDNEDSFDANITSLATATQMSETELSGTISAILEMRYKDIDKTTETRLFYMTDKMDEILSRIGSR